LTAAWAAAAVALLRRAEERLGLLALGFCALAALAALTAAVVDHRPGDDIVALVRAFAVALLPAVALNVLLALPSGSIVTRAQRLAVGVGYLITGGVGVLLWTDRPSLPTWPLVIEAFATAALGVLAVRSRYPLTRGFYRRRLQWMGWAIAVVAEVVLVTFALHALFGWPPYVLEIAAVATISIPMGLALGASKRFESSIDRLLVHTVSLAGLTALVVAVYAVIVIGLGRAPNDEQRELLLLSMVAAGVAALLFVPVRDRLAAFANQLVHGTRRPPEDLVRNFGARLSRAVPLEELLLQLAESLRSTLALAAAEIWTGFGGKLERVVSDPDRGPASLRLTGPEEAVVAGSGVAGPAWAAAWLPQLLADRGDATLRIAPITSSGELFGLIVVERSSDDEPFGEDDENLLQELARRVALALRNVRLDAELQASLEELRSQAEELRASRARIVVAGDAERRRIERDLHDGAQQYLVGLAVQLRLARELADSDATKVRRMLDELCDAVQEAQQALRDLAHGIYPPLLQDRGLQAALTAAAGRTSMPARVEASGIRRYGADVEATVYFCCLEALQNAAKYAGDEARATIRLQEEEGRLLFEVADNGVGFESTGGAGSGLTNMQDRLGAIGGSLRVEPGPGRGTKVVGAIPLER
ncbi:MAG: GAF domain-containing sensor histidine kinase, partial [Actinomycetota bacterium]|nr:GAF domain-containing sensor histidine kinase [Actinomycetota bacterium]